MKQKFLRRFLSFRSDNLKPVPSKVEGSKNCTELSRSIQNRKWVGRFAIVVALTVCGARAETQQPKKVPRLGYLSSADPVRYSAGSDAIRLALRERGYIEGQNIATEYRYAQGKRDRVPELVAELVRLNVDIIVVAGGLRTIQAAKNATKTIPIIMTGEGT